MCHVTGNTKQEKIIEVYKNRMVSYGSNVLAEPNDILENWLDQTSSQYSCSDLLIYKLNENSWHIKPIVLKCKKALDKCKKDNETICVPKCCPVNHILDVNKEACIKLGHKTGPPLPLLVPIRSSNLSYCNHLDAFGKSR